jgi:hypothetical protein
MLFALACHAIGEWLRRAMLALAQPPAHADRNVPKDFYGYPLF